MQKPRNECSADLKPYSEKALVKAGHVDAQNVLEQKIDRLPLHRRSQPFPGEESTSNGAKQLNQLAVHAAMKFLFRLWPLLSQASGLR